MTPMVACRKSNSTNIEQSPMGLKPLAVIQRRPYEINLHVRTNNSHIYEYTDISTYIVLTTWSHVPRPTRMCTSKSNSAAYLKHSRSPSYIAS